MDKTYDRLVPDYDVYRNRKVPGGEAPALPIHGVSESRRRRVTDVAPLPTAAPTPASL